MTNNRSENENLVIVLPELARVVGEMSDFHGHTQPGLALVREAVLLSFMPKISAALLLALALAATGCSGVNGLNVGTDPDAQPNGSYSGSTLNSPVTDQNPHPGGDSSYPSSVSDQGVVPPPPDRSDGR